MSASNADCPCGCFVENSTTTSSSSSLSVITSESGGDSNVNLDDDVFCDDVIHASNEHVGAENILQTILASSQNTYKNITISNSKQVHLGNVTHINGPIYIKQTSKSTGCENCLACLTLENKVAPVTKVRLVSRRNWVAQPPLENHAKLRRPAKYVVISHTSTEEGANTAENILHVRLIQMFHIESRNWSDIGYNFLVGSCGNVFEGRGWGVEGAHTKYFNKLSVGISFIGYFSHKLPPKSALDQAKALIEEGIAQNYIDPDYKLIGHCQCTSTESPGKMLFEEIKTWKNFCADISVDNLPSEIFVD